MRGDEIGRSGNSPGPSSDLCGVTVRTETPATLGTWVLTILLTTAMALSMLPLFLLGALGPRLLGRFHFAAASLGILVAAGFAVAAALSLVVGPAVAAIGARRCLIAMFAVSSAGLTIFAVAPGYWALVVAITVAGFAQALANPATNQLIAAQIPAHRRANVAGWKQSGVQFGAFLAGLPLAAIATAVNWRVAVGVAAGVAALAAGLTLAVTKDPRPPRIPALRVARPRGDAGWMAGYSVLLGAGISAINTYVAVYAVKQLGFAAGAASALVAVLGVAGIVGRVGWTRWSVRLRSPAILLGPLAVGAAASALAMLAASGWGGGLAWVGVLGIGCCAVSANAVSMMTVIATAPPEHLGRDSAVVSAGFFAGFVLGPTAFGLIGGPSIGRHTAAWALVAIEFLAAAGVALWWRMRAAPAAV